MQLEFRPVRLEDKATIDSYLKPHAFECSEFTFTNFIIWGQDNKIQWAQHNDVLYIRLQFGKHQPFLFPPIPRSFNTDYSAAIMEACKYFDSIGVMPRFRSVSGPFVELFRNYCSMMTPCPIAIRSTMSIVLKISLSSKAASIMRSVIISTNSHRSTRSPIGL